MVVKKKKSTYRIVPHTNEKFGNCWALKDRETLIGVFISKQHAEVRKANLEKASFEDFLLESTRYAEIKIKE